jgi:hypothetical protein
MMNGASGLHDSNDTNESTGDRLVDENSQFQIGNMYEIQDAKVFEVFRICNNLNFEVPIWIVGRACIVGRAWMIGSLNFQVGN